MERQGRGGLGAGDCRVRGGGLGGGGGGDGEAWVRAADCTCALTSLTRRRRIPHNPAVMAGCLG